MESLQKARDELAQAEFILDEDDLSVDRVVAKTMLGIGYAVIALATEVQSLREDLRSRSH